MRWTNLAPLLIPFTLVAAACAADTNEDPVSSDEHTESPGVQAEELGAKPTFATTGHIVVSTCGGCHAKFQTLAGIKADKKNMVSMISAGAMPRGNPTWKNSADGKSALNWLKTGADLR